MNVSSITNIITTIVEIVGIIIAILELIKKNKDTSETQSVTYIDYRETVNNNHSKTRESTANNSSDSIFIIYAIGGLMIFIAALAFHSVFSTILAIITSVYLFKVIYFVKKEKIPTHFSAYLLSRAIFYTFLSFSTYYFHPALLNISDQFPDVLQSQRGASYFLDWLITSGKIVIDNVLNFSNSNTVSSFPYAYILARTSGMAFFISYIIPEIKTKKLLHQLYKFETKPVKTVGLNILLVIVLVMLYHINLIYFSVIIPILDAITTWMNA
jgi:hypothetical protein